MNKCLLLSSMLCASAALAAPVWTWVDETGQRHYSDRPVPGAQRIDLPEYEEPPAPRGASEQPANGSPPGEEETETPDARPYRRFEVVSPSQQETLWNIGGTLAVEVGLEPALQPGHRLDVYLDGTRLGLETTQTRFTVPEVYRGVHSLQAAVLDAQGEEVLRSLAVTFMVQQTSIQNPNNPNAPGN